MSKIKPIVIGNSTITDIQITPIVIDLNKAVALWTAIITGEKISYQQNFMVEKVEYTTLLSNLNLDWVINFTIANLGLEKP